MNGDMNEDSSAFGCALQVQGDTVASDPVEQKAWDAVSAIAATAVDFWVDFLRLRMGPKHDQLLTTVARARLLTMIRAISWVESRHGTGSGTFPAKDPMQCGRDAWWDELVHALPPAGSRFITGPGGSNYYANELPAAMESAAGFPKAAKHSSLAKPADGVRDKNYGPTTSYYWAVPLFIHRTNTKAGDKAYQCGDLAEARLVKGAYWYNGKGDPKYETAIEAALKLIGGLPLRAATKPEMLTITNCSEEARRAVAAVLTSVTELAGAENGRHRLFPNGIEQISLDVSIGVSGTQLKVSVSGRS